MAPPTLTAPSSFLVKHSSAASPAALAFSAGSRRSLGRCSFSHLRGKQKQSVSAVACKAHLRLDAISLRTTALWEDYRDMHSSTFAVKDVPAPSSAFTGTECSNSTNLNLIPSYKFRRPLNPPRAAAYNDVFKFRYPVIKEKPDWFWRTVACVPYLIALQISDAGYFINRFVERYDVFEGLVYFVPGINRLPPWFSMIYCYFSYVSIVKNTDWSHFTRFHLMMGMLLETGLQVVWYIGNFFPLIHYNGTFGTNVWAGVGLIYILTILRCVRSALAGEYADIPFLSEAAYIHTLFNVGSSKKKRS